MENPEIPGRIQTERFIPVEIFRKKVFVWITSARLHVQRKQKITVNGTTIL